MKPDQRPSLEKAQSLSSGGIFVEIGTWDGDFSWALLQSTRCAKLYCVDPYKHFEDASYPDGMNLLTQKEFDKKYETARARFAEFGDRVVFLRMTSEEAAQQFPGESIDFVYVDGNHDYKAVLKDLMLWLPKVKKGGILAGDDIYSTDLREHDANGNVLRIWGRDAAGNPNCFGHYGTYKALRDAQKRLGFEYFIDGTQFSIAV